METNQTKNDEEVVFQSLPDAVPTAGLQIMSTGSWIAVDPRIWRAWTGRRAVWGLEHHGPVYEIDTHPEKLWTGKRTCPCSVCQASVSELMRPN